MSKAKLKVDVKTVIQGEKIAEAKPKVVLSHTASKLKGKPLYRSTAKLNTHLRIGRKR